MSQAWSPAIVQLLGPCPPKLAALAGSGWR